jgi:outer membrane lipoprotein carrier protein
LPSPPTGEAALDRFLAEVQTLRADFRQELWDAGETLLETSVGELLIKRPNRFLWRYRSPIEQLIVADGARIWMYDVELAQVTVTPLDAPAASSPAMLLSGDRAVRDSFEVLDSFAADGLDWVRLAPKLEDSDFRSILIGFRDGALAQLELTDGLDQTTRIELENVELNVELAETAFEFEPPPGVDVIGDP